jgi:hypothetical protein
MVADPALHKCGTQRTISVADLIRHCNETASKMGSDNPNKVLLLNCAFAMKQLVDRLEFHESKTRAQ